MNGVTKRLLNLTKINSVVCNASTGTDTLYILSGEGLEALAGGAARLDLVYRVPGFDNSGGGSPTVTLQTAANPSDDEFNATDIETRTFTAEDIQTSTICPAYDGKTILPYLRLKVDIKNVANYIQLEVDAVIS